MLETYADLLAAIQKLTPEQLKQKVQVNDPTDGSQSDDSRPVVLMYAYCMGTVRELFEIESEHGNPIEDHQIVRDSVDGKHKSDSVVILVDRSGHEDDTEWKKLRVALKALENIRDFKTPIRAEEIARVALEKMTAIDEKKKEKNAKVCV